MQPYYVLKLEHDRLMGKPEALEVCLCVFMYCPINISPCAQNFKPNIFLNCSCTNIHFVSLYRNNLDLLVLLIEPHMQTNISVHVLQLKLTSVIGKVWLTVYRFISPGSSNPGAPLQSDELSGVITVPQRPVTQIKAALPRLASTKSRFCSTDPALMRNSTPLPRYIMPFSICLAPFTFT